MCRIMHYFSALVFATVTVAAVADPVYRWVDEDGNVSYHERPAPLDMGFENKEIEIQEGSLSNEDQAMGRAAKAFPIVLYSIKRCTQCDLVRNHLRKHKIPFTERNVETDRKFQKEVLAKTGSLTLPVILVGDRVMNGYVETLLEAELKQAGYPIKKADEKSEEYMEES